MTTDSDAPGLPVGIRDVAKSVGVSLATASLAINGQPGVAEATRHRILAAAERLGYRANPQAQALRRGRTTTYGFVVRNFANPFFLEVLSGLSRSRPTRERRSWSWIRATRWTASAWTCRNWRPSGWRAWPSPRSAPASRSGSGMSCARGPRWSR